MKLTDHQKIYVKSNYRSKAVVEIAQDLNIPKSEIEEYLKNRIGEYKYKKLQQSHLLKPQPKEQLPGKSILEYLKRHRYLYLLLGVLVALVYGLCLGNGFVSDDIAEIVNKPELGTSQYIINHLSGFVRPVLYTIVFYTFGRETAFGFHLINLLFHLLTTLTLFTLLSLLYSRRVALISSIIVAVHPLLSETVVWVSGGTYTQYSFFFLLSLLLYLNYRKYLNINFTFQWNYYIALIAYSLTLTSHTVMSFAFLPILITYEILFGSLKKKF